MHTRVHTEASSFDFPRALANRSNPSGCTLQGKDLRQTETCSDRVVTGNVTENSRQQPLMWVHERKAVVSTDSQSLVRHTQRTADQSQK